MYASVYVSTDYQTCHVRGILFDGSAWATVNIPGKPKRHGSCNYIPMSTLNIALVSIMVTVVHIELIRNFPKAVFVVERTCM